jgi:hypothetical protein
LTFTRRKPAGHRFGRRLKKDRKLARSIVGLEAQLSNGEI